MRSSDAFKLHARPSQRPVRLFDLVVATPKWETRTVRVARALCFLIEAASCATAFYLFVYFAFGIHLTRNP